MFAPDQLIQTIAAAMHKVAQALDAERAVHGLDALDEIALHPIVENALASHNMGVHREFPYPAPAKLRPDHRERERCDLVLTQDPDAPPADPVRERKEQDQALGTLFAPLADAIPSGEKTTPLDACYWLEVKVVGQFTYTEGVPGPNRTYTSLLTRGPAADIAKLARDRFIIYAGVLVVLFTADQRTAEHDLGVMVDKMLDRSLRIASPSIESFPINDRIGNAVCTLAMVPLRRTR